MKLKIGLTQNKEDRNAETVETALTETETVFWPKIPFSFKNGSSHFDIFWTPVLSILNLALIEHFSNNLAYWYKLGILYNPNINKKPQNDRYFFNLMYNGNFDENSI